MSGLQEWSEPGKQGTDASGRPKGGWANDRWGCNSLWRLAKLKAIHCFRAFEHTPSVASKLDANRAWETAHSWNLYAAAPFRCYQHL